MAKKRAGWGERQHGSLSDSLNRGPIKLSASCLGRVAKRSNLQQEERNATFSRPSKECRGGKGDGQMIPHDRSDILDLDGVQPPTLLEDLLEHDRLISRSTL